MIDLLEKNIKKRISKVALLLFASACMTISSCGNNDSEKSDYGVIENEDFSKIVDYQVRIPTMYVSQLTEKYPGISEITTTYSEQIFDKNSGLLQSMKIDTDGIEGSRFRYDTDGQLSALMNGQNEISVEYDDKGLPDGFKYKIDKNGYITKAYTPDGDISRSFKNHDSGLISSFSERARSAYNDKIRKYEYQVKYDIYGDIVTIKGRKMMREYTYRAYAARTYSPNDRDELNPTSNWKSFAECKKIPTPDSCINIIKKDKSPAKGEYIYLIPGKSDLQIRNQLTIGYYDFLFGAYCSKPEGSDEIYYEYLSILKDVCFLELTVNDDGNTLISDYDGNVLGTLCYMQVNGKGSCLKIKFI